MPVTSYSNSSATNTTTSSSKSSNIKSYMPTKTGALWFFSILALLVAIGGAVLGSLAYFTNDNGGGGSTPVCPPKGCRIEAQDVFASGAVSSNSVSTDSIIVRSNTNMTNVTITNATISNIVNQVTFNQGFKALGTSTFETVQFNDLNVDVISGTNLNYNNATLSNITTTSLNANNSTIVNSSGSNLNYDTSSFKSVPSIPSLILGNAAFVNGEYELNGSSSNLTFQLNSTLTNYTFTLDPTKLKTGQNITLILEATTTGVISEANFANNIKSIFIKNISVKQASPADDSNIYLRYAGGELNPTEELVLLTRKPFFQTVVYNIVKTTGKHANLYRSEGFFEDSAVDTLTVNTIKVQPRIFTTTGTTKNITFGLYYDNVYANLFNISNSNVWRYTQEWFWNMGTDTYTTLPVMNINFTNNTLTELTNVSLFNGTLFTVNMIKADGNYQITINNQLINTTIVIYSNLVSGGSLNILSATTETIDVTRPQNRQITFKCINTANATPGNPTANPPVSATPNQIWYFLN